MNDAPNLPTGSQDDLRAENEVLKLKLELEHGMRDFGSVLSPEAENQWLKSVYDFECMLKLANDLTVYDLIGRPAIKPYDGLTLEEAAAELKIIMELLAKNGITLAAVRSCNDVELYRTITEQFLPMKFGEFKNGPLFPPVGSWFGGGERSL